MAINKNDMGSCGHMAERLKQLRDLMLVVLVVLILESFQILCSSFLPSRNS